MKTRAAPLLSLCLLAACQQTIEALWSAVTPAPPPPVAPAPPDPRFQALKTLDAMDARKPVPLIPMMAQHQKQNMRDHLLAVQEIVLALAANDYAAVEKANSRIAPSPQMAQMCTHMGAGAPGFSEQALGFHQTAAAISVAAKKKDRRGVLSALGKTLATCTACHEAWKQSVVDERTWSEATKTAAPSMDEAMRRQHEMMQRVMMNEPPP